MLGIIYASVDDDRISELTAVRTIGSVPFAGRYRLIDFALSNMVNAGITAVGVSTKSNYRSLMDHLGAGKPWDLARKRDGLTILPPFDLAGNGGVSRNRIEALHAMLNYMGHSNKEYVLLADANVVATLDYEALMENHERSGADITIAYRRGRKPNLPDIMTFAFGDGD
ncbi:MAG: glucose-1-phosphate adenylyltransferase subunit GlgD, partial [Clostridia bacterium]|nr:glucose-1-phosphate adenylyltransferase subunit GlgD [Clostridia bacterium]